MAFSIKILGKQVLEVGFSEQRSADYGDKHIAQVIREIMGTTTSTTVTESTAVKLTAIYRAINIIADTIATLPIDVYRVDGKSKYIDRKHPVQQLIRYRPNPLMTSLQFRYAMTAMALLRGGSYAHIIRDGRARPVELQVYANPYDVTPFTYKNNLFYQIRGQELPIPDNDMFRILWTTFDGITPVSPIKAAAIAISRGLSAQAYSESIFANGGTRKIAIKSPGRLDPEAKENLRDSWLNVHSKVENAHKPAILQGGIDIAEIGIKPEEAQLLETQEFTIAEIARLYGVPLHMLASSKANSYNSNEQQDIEFNKYTMNAWYVRWEDESMDKLLYERERTTHIINIDNTELMRGDSKTRINYLRGRFLMGSITPNQVRLREGENPSDEENADKLFTQAQMIPLEMAGAKYTQPDNQQKTNNDGK